MDNAPVENTIPVFIRSGIVSHYKPGYKFMEMCLLHGKVWPEGDNFEDKNGKACRECVEKSMRLNPNLCPNCKGNRFKTIFKGQLYKCRSPFKIMVGPFRSSIVEGCGWKGNTLLTLFRKEAN